MGFRELESVIKQQPSAAGQYGRSGSLPKLGLQIMCPLAPLPLLAPRRSFLTVIICATVLQAPQKLHLTLFEKLGDVYSSANARLLLAGLARFAAPPRGVDGGEVAEALLACEEKARRGHVGMWRYGDPGEDSDQVGKG